ncbi:MAG: hypothetical protein EB059_01240 [Alphaproteobacteria bacterium]|nr:hypothetical protein [Alphaproteobacteria bacterium]
MGAQSYFKLIFLNATDVDIRNALSEAAQKYVGEMEVAVEGNERKTTFRSAITRSSSVRFGHSALLNGRTEIKNAFKILEMRAAAISMCMKLDEKHQTSPRLYSRPYHVWRCLVNREYRAIAKNARTGQETMAHRPDYTIPVTQQTGWLTLELK